MHIHTRNCVMCTQVFMLVWAMCVYTNALHFIYIYICICIYIYVYIIIYIIMWIPAGK